MNPYDFARIDWSKPPKRHKPVWHHHLVETGKRLFSGSMEVDIYAETPIFIANSARRVEVAVTAIGPAPRRRAQ